MSFGPEWALVMITYAMGQQQRIAVVQGFGTLSKCEAAGAVVKQLETHLKTTCIQVN